MKKINRLMLCFLSITATLCAQETNKETTRLFELPPYSIHQTFRIDLGKENQLWLQLGQMQDLAHWSNIDSILQVFLNDMKTFRDSLSDPSTTKRIDYVIDLSGRKRIRIRQSRPPGAAFLLDQGEPALLKLEQDSIHILLMFPSSTGVRYNRLSFYINQYSGLEGFINGSLNNKLRLLRQNVGSQYIGNDWTSRMGVNYMKADPSISSEHFRFAHAEEENRNSLLLNTTVRVDAQNYKNYFTPSFSLGVAIRLSVGEIQHAFKATWEPFFFFTTDAQGHTQTLHNDFLVFSYIYGNAPRHADEKPVNLAFGIRPAFSLGYLVNREGAYFEKHSFRLSAARLNLYQDNIYLEPCMYFHDLFRGVTPGIRISLEGFF
jgi:hypothetical protein